MFFPYEIWAGIGIGTVNDKIIKSSSFTGSNMIDGESYHKAVQAITECKDSNVNCKVLSSENKMDDVNDILEICCRMKQEMTNKQLEIYSLFSIIFPLIPIDIEKKKQYEELLLIKINYYKPSEQTKKMINNTFEEMNEHREIYYKKYNTRLVYPIADLLCVSNENIRKIREAGKFDLIRKSENVVLNMLK